MKPNDEKIVIVDKNNKVTGWSWRSHMRERRLIHRATFIIVFNDADQLFVQKRTLSKDIYPGYYDLTAGGVVQVDEAVEVSARRELEEELGIVKDSLDFLFEFFYESPENNVWGSVYQCIFNGCPVLQKEEIDFGQFQSLEDVDALIRNEPVTPESVYLFNRYKKIIRTRGVK